MNEREIFLEALEKTSDTARHEYLDIVCAEDAELRQRIEDLLDAKTKVDGFLETPPPGLALTIHSDSPTQFGQSLSDLSLDFLTPSDKPGCLGTIGTYEIVGLIGRGGFGLVLRVYDPKLNRIVAVKVMAPELATNPVAVKRFLREAQAAAAVRHDHVVTIHAIEETHQPPFIVMAYVEGQSLKDRVDQEGPLELAEILRIGIQMSSGLAAAHAQGLVHRDIKPANILLENGIKRVKITDFGLARAVDDTGMTQSGMIAGTPRYMSPEQGLGKPVDARSDLFSLGSVLYTLCTGRAAFQADSAVATLRRVCDDTPEPIRELNPKIPRWLEQIVMRLLEKSPQQRYQSAEEVSQLFSDCLAHVQSANSSSDTPPPLKLTGTSSPAVSAGFSWYATLVKIHMLLIIGTLIASFADVETIIFTLPVFLFGVGLILAVTAWVTWRLPKHAAYGLTSMVVPFLVVLVIVLGDLGPAQPEAVWAVLVMYVMIAIPWGFRECQWVLGEGQRSLGLWKNHDTFVSVFVFQLIGIAAAAVAAQIEIESIAASGIFQGLIFGGLLTYLAFLIGRHFESQLFAIAAPVFCFLATIVILAYDLPTTNTFGGPEQRIAHAVLAFAIVIIPTGLWALGRELELFSMSSLPQFNLRTALIGTAMMAIAFAGAQPCMVFGSAAYIAGVLFVLTLLCVSGLIGYWLYRRQGNFRPAQWLGIGLTALVIQVLFMSLVVWYDSEIPRGYLLVNTKTPVTIMAHHVSSGNRYTFLSTTEEEAFLSGLEGTVQLSVVDRNDLKVVPASTQLHRYMPVQVKVVASSRRSRGSP